MDKWINQSQKMTIVTFKFNNCFKFLSDSLDLHLPPIPPPPLSHLSNYAMIVQQNSIKILLIKLKHNERVRNYLAKVSKIEKRYV